MSEKREFTGVFIPAHIWESKDLLPVEKMLLGEIDALSKKTGWCTASRAHFAEWMRCEHHNVTYYTNKLEKEGFIIVERKVGVRSKMRVCPEKFHTKPVNPIDPSTPLTSQPRRLDPSTPLTGPVNPIDPKYNSKENIKENNASLTREDDEENQTSSLKEKKENTPQIPARPPKRKLGWDDYPEYRTPEDLIESLRLFYAKEKESWKQLVELINRKGAQYNLKYDSEKIGQLIEDFACWATGEFRGKDFTSLNTRLRQWLSRAPGRENEQNNKPAKPGESGLRKKVNTNYAPESEQPF